MIKDLQHRIYDQMANFKRPDAVEYTPIQLRAFAIINKKAAPKKPKIKLSKTHPAYKVLSAPGRHITDSQRKAYRAFSKANKANYKNKTTEQYRSLLKKLGIKWVV